MSDYRAALLRDRMSDAKKALDHLVAIEHEQKRQAAEQKREATRQKQLARQAPAKEPAPRTAAKPEADAAIPPAAKPAPKVEAPAVAATREGPAEADAPGTGSIAPNHPVAHERTAPIHTRRERHPPVSTVKSRERERRLAAREREQRRLRAEFEGAERASERRVVRRQPQIRYYRAGSRDPSFSDIFR